jgi:hypothetical protein
MVFVSDRDVRFTSVSWEEFTKLLDRKLRFSMAFHPQSNGLSEKANDSVQIFLLAYALQSVNE